MSEKKVAQARLQGKPLSPSVVSRLYKAAFPYWNSGGYVCRIYKSDLTKNPVLAFSHKPGESILAVVRRWILREGWAYQESKSIGGVYFFEVTRG